LALLLNEPRPAGLSTVSMYSLLNILIVPASPNGPSYLLNFFGHVFKNIPGRISRLITAVCFLFVLFAEARFYAIPLAVKCSCLSKAPAASSLSLYLTAALCG